MYFNDLCLVLNMKAVDFNAIFFLSDFESMYIISIDDEDEVAQSAVKKFHCNCGRSYIHKRDLQRHKYYQCGKEPQFKCMHCPYRANLKNYLENHIRNKHLNFCGEDK